MNRRLLLSAIFLLTLTGPVAAQQEPDLKYEPPISSPAYAPAAGPRVAIDAAHHNFHTADGRYEPFARLLRRDGYRVTGLDAALSPATLAAVDLLVIANPLHERNTEDWSLPTPSAFTPEEIAAVHAWVDRGGSLLLIVDHMPFPGAAGDLARAFGVRFSNGYAQAGRPGAGVPDLFDGATGLRESAVTRGRGPDEKVTSVATFTGSAFKPPQEASPVLVFSADAVSLETTKAPGVTPDAPAIPIAGWCQGAILGLGKGRVAVFGEAAMFTAQLAGPQQVRIGMNSPAAPQNHRLLLNVAHWLTRAQGMPD